MKNDLEEVLDKIIQLLDALSPNMSFVGHGLVRFLTMSYFLLNALLVKANRVLFIIPTAGIILIDVFITGYFRNRKTKQQFELAERLRRQALIKEIWKK